MLFNILNRYSGQVQVSVEIECAENASHSIKLGLAVKAAIKMGASLSGADLSGVNLSGADLSGEDLCEANLSGAYLSGANFSGANFSGANLYRANLSGANFSGAKATNGEELIRNNPIITLGPLGSRNDYLLVQRCISGVYVKAGCFFGDLASFKEAVTKTHGDNKHAKNYLAACALIEEWSND